MNNGVGKFINRTAYGCAPVHFTLPLLPCSNTPLRAAVQLIHGNATHTDACGQYLLLLQTAEQDVVVDDGVDGRALLPGLCVHRRLPRRVHLNRLCKYTLNMWTGKTQAVTPDAWLAVPGGGGGGWNHIWDCQSPNRTERRMPCRPPRGRIGTSSSSLVSALPSVDSDVLQARGASRRRTGQREGLEVHHALKVTSKSQPAHTAPFVRGCTVLVPGIERLQLLCEVLYGIVWSCDRQLPQTKGDGR